MQGTRAIGHREIWRLAGPMILSNISIPLLGAADTAVVGHLGDPAYIGAVAIGAMIFSFLFWGFGFLRMSTTGLAAQAFGQADADAMRATLARSMLIGGGAALLVLALQVPIAQIAFTLVDASTDVERHARTYVAIRIWSAPATLATYSIIGWFVGMQNTRAPLYLLLAGNGLNIALDLILAVGLDLRVAGVAWASLIAEWSTAALGLWLVRRELARYGGQWRRDLILDLAALKRLIAVNGDIFVRTLCLIFSFAYFTSRGASLGEVTLAANAVLMNFMTFAAYGLDGFAHAAEALVGRAIGRRDAGQFAQAVRISGLWGAGTALAVSAVYFAAGPAIIAFLTSVEAVRAAAALYLPWAAALPLVAVWCYWLDGVFIGATWSRDMRNTMVASLIVYLVPAIWLPDIMGNHGLWLAMTLFMAARGVTMGMVYLARRRRLAASPA